jgi:hypothetical protein
LEGKLRGFGVRGARLHDEHPPEVILARDDVVRRSVWRGGHAHGPRYLVDVLPLLIPIAAEGAAVLARNRPSSAVAAGAPPWSVALAATGVFCCPVEQWNCSPDDVDVRHERPWNWQDPQFVRCWNSGLSPQDFVLFRADASRAGDQRPPG